MMKAYGEKIKKIKPRLKKVHPFIPGSIPISEHLRQGFLIGVDETQGA